MKTSYTTFSSALRKASKITGVDFRLIAERAVSVMESMSRERASITDSRDMGRYWGGMICKMDVEIIEGRAIHIFVPGMEFCRWLAGCVKSLSPEVAKQSAQCLLSNSKVGVLHFPCGQKLASAAFHIAAKTATDDWKAGPDYGLLFINWSNHSNGDGLGYASFPLDGTDLSILGGERLFYAKLIFGLGIYVNSFPETIRPGLPDSLKHPSEHNYKTKISIEITDKIHSPEGIHHNSPTPHFRRGHFRILRSDCFTNKRFQSVFVHETFVKGRAETVLAPEEIAA